MTKSDIYREFSTGEDVVVTPYATVRLSAKSLRRLAKIDNNWRGVLYNRRLRSKANIAKRAEIQSIIDEVDTQARKAWKIGSILEIY